MDLRLPPANLSLGLKPATLTRPASDGAVGGVAGGFTGAMKSALHEVSAAQTVSLEDTMVAILKAQIGFQATLHVRNRMVQAYTDIMNMQV